MATKPATRRRRPAANTKPRNGRAKAPATPGSIPAQSAAPETTVPLVCPEADPVLADAADRAADLRDQAADDVARILADGQVRVTELLDGARTEAASITEAANAEQSRLLAAAATDADRVRTEAATSAAADADQVRVATETEAAQLLADARRQADTLAATAADEAERVLADAKAAVDQLLADACRQAQEVTITAAAQAERVSAEAAQVRTAAEKAAAELREDAAREREAARADAVRARTLASEDIGRMRATAAEDAERLTRSAREEADRLLAAARTKREAELKEAGEALSQARLREADAEVTLKAADDMVAEAAARMKRATDRTEQALERQRLKDAAREERRGAKEARRTKARELREASRAGKPTRVERVKEFVRVNAERLMVIGPITAPMAVAWTGQAGFAEDILGWAMPFTILFAAAWELSTAFVGWMYHQARRGGDAGTLYRVSTWIFALGAAVMNFWHASGEPTPGSRVWDAKEAIWTEQMTYWNFTPKAVAFAAMSIVGMVLWELYASLIHRRTLREDGKVAKARPSIGAVRWIRYPVHSFTAWSLAITDASLTTLDRAWTAAGAQLAVREAVRTANEADRRAVRTGRALHRVVVPRVGADDHGPAAIPMVLTLTRTDRSGPGHGPLPVRPVRRESLPVQPGPEDRTAVHGPVRTAGATDRTGGPARALEFGPAGPHRAEQRTTGGPDRTAKTVPPAQKAPAGQTVSVRTDSGAQGPDRSGPETGPQNTREAGPDRTAAGAGPDRTNSAGPDRTGQGGPDRTVIELTDRERTALDRLRTANEPLNRTNIANAVRTEGGTIATDRAGQIAVALKQHTVR
ncbi:hypothetical protein [Streptomyces microflavus]|uniref:hypothetical protein n=1 Tax=Streptomyces microflavus TaxID=1919 RepID=UPI003663B1AD